MICDGANCGTCVDEDPIKGCDIVGLRTGGKMAICYNLSWVLAEKQVTFGFSTPFVPITGVGCDPDGGGELACRLLRALWVVFCTRARDVAVGTPCWESLLNVAMESC